MKSKKHELAIQRLITLCTYMQQGYVFGHVGLCAFMCIILYVAKKLAV